MNIYRLIDSAGAVTYHATIHAAQAEGKKDAPVFRAACRITLHGFSTAKEALVFAANRGFADLLSAPHRTWKLSNRGVLRIVEPTPPCASCSGTGIGESAGTWCMPCGGSGLDE